MCSYIVAVNIVKRLLHQATEPQSVAQVHGAHREAEVVLHGKVGAGLARSKSPWCFSSTNGECSWNAGTKWGWTLAKHMGCDGCDWQTKGECKLLKLGCDRQIYWDFKSVKIGTCVTSMGYLQCVASIQISQKMSQLGKSKEPGNHYLRYVKEKDFLQPLSSKPNHYIQIPYSIDILGGNNPKMYLQCCFYQPNMWHKTWWSPHRNEDLTNPRSKEGWPVLGGRVKSPLSVQSHPRAWAHPISHPYL